jgi:AcrR family transcriptional regulator
MPKQKHSLVWLNEGYTIFADEGLEGIQVERLARRINLNKSSFYHYFGDLEGFYFGLMLLHEENVSVFLHDVVRVVDFDPGYLELLTKNKLMVMFQVQLMRYRTDHPFYKTGESLDKKINLTVRKIWSDYIVLPQHADLAMRYYYIVRDMLYTRVNHRNLNYTYLHDFMSEARRLISDLSLYINIDPPEHVHSNVEAIDCFAEAGRIECYL